MHHTISTIERLVAYGFELKPGIRAELPVSIDSAGFDSAGFDPAAQLLVDLQDRDKQIQDHLNADRRQNSTVPVEQNDFSRQAVP